jgi:hypothetical protein
VERKNMTILKLSVATAILSFVAFGAANAAEVCYEDVRIPAHYDCNGSSSKSADFTTGCRQYPDEIKKVEVECPPRPAVWLPAGPLKSQTEVCKAAGMVITDIDGIVCGSRERKRNGTIIERASTETYFGNCRHTSDSAPCQTIGSRVLGNDNFSGIMYLCWNPGDRKDYDPSDAVNEYPCRLK